MARDNDRDILLTGFPSFLARRLVKTILEREPDATVRIIVLSSLFEEAQQALDDMRVDRGRIDLLEGDVCAIDLGLSGPEYLELMANITDIYHLASIWHLGVDRKRIFEVNVRGLRNVIDAAEEMKALRRLNHLSTAFVAGDRRGVIMENELEEGQSFRNAYEETKFEAELALREVMGHLPVTIFRPTIVVGDSKTGEIDRMAGPYYLMNAIVQMPESVPILMPGKGDKPLNLVPVDYVCEAMHTISRADGATGKAFHLADPHPLSARKVFELVAEHAGKNPPVARVPYRLTKWIMNFPYLEKLTRNPRQFIEDFNQLSIYNGINTAQVLAGDERCPPFPSYVEKLVDFIEASEKSLEVGAGANGAHVY